MNIPSADSDLTNRFEVALSGNPNIAMTWSEGLFHRKIFLTHRIVLVNWPTEVRFSNMSRMGSLPVLQDVLDQWESGHIHFKQLTYEKFEEAQDQCDGNGQWERMMTGVGATREPRFDVGEKRPPRKLETRTKKRALKVEKQWRGRSTKYVDPKWDNAPQ